MPERRSLSTTVTEAAWLTPSMVRIVVGGPDLEGFGAGEFTDHYVKCRFGDKTRSYTVRAWDPERLLLTLDFVVHGDAGIAGPWAAGAKPGDQLEIRGPGGAYTPSPEADWHLMVGDDAALPAIAVSLSRVPAGVPVFVVVEVEGPEHQQPLESAGDLRVTWVHRGHDAAGQDPSLQLDAVRALSLPVGQGHAFVHGEATTVRLVRRHLVLECGLPVESLSASGYWKLRRTDEEWRAEKREWIATAEADLAGNPAA
ncbi:MAG TPA: siderophore-interacting protein [Solirubrobacteraceae bacterium]|jgi:NADPH-dependent ferric siderophore reductase|nr:siderophore-interacting protein [Solirubrobacteraceae bacterium]